MNVSDFGFDLPAELIAQAPAAERGASRLLVLHKDTRARGAHACVPPRRISPRGRPARRQRYESVSGAPARRARAERRRRRMPAPREPRRQGADREAMGCAGASRAEAAAWRADDLSRRAARAARRSLGAPLSWPAHDSALVRERRERRRRHRRHRPHAAAAVYQARGHDERSRSVSDRLCARARFGRRADGRPPFHARASRRPGRSAASSGRRSRCTSATARFSRSGSIKVEAHTIDAERFSISEAAADAINRAKREKRRIIAVGTTTTRALEAAGRAGRGVITPQSAGATCSFIRASSSASSTR